MSFNKTKTDPELGKKVHEHLLSLGIETPMVDTYLNADAKDKIEVVEYHMTKILQVMGMDLSDDSLMETPKRIAKMMVLEHAWGMLPENFPKCTTVKNKIDYDEMVKVKDIKIMSQCEHHWQTIDGYATIAYIPTGGVDVIGLSKLSRICDYFARRPQIQERLTCQIFEALRFILKTDNIAVHINAKHYCMVGRGIEDASAMTSTSKLGGAFKTQPATRSEFFSMLE